MPFYLTFRFVAHPLGSRGSAGPRSAAPISVIGIAISATAGTVPRGGGTSAS